MSCLGYVLVPARYLPPQGTFPTVMLLYRRDVEKRVSLLITGNTHANCILAPYSDVEEVEEFISANMHDSRPEREAFAP